MEANGAVEFFLSSGGFGRLVVGTTAVVLRFTPATDLGGTGTVALGVTFTEVELKYWFIAEVEVYNCVQNIFQILDRIIRHKNLVRYFMNHCSICSTR